MAKDPAFLFYPADASEETQFMNRLERGCYFDILKAQKKFRRFTIELIKKVLGVDFEQCWPALESILVKDGEFYFIGWVNDAIENRAEHSAKQKKRIQDYWDRKKQESENKPDQFQNYTTEQPQNISGNSLENENAIANESVITNEDKGVQGETGFVLDDELKEIQNRTAELFSVSEIRNARSFMQIGRALFQIKRSGKLDYYRDQLEGYFKFKNESKEQKCNPTTWLYGSKESIDITAGHWCREDWGHKLKWISTPQPQSNFSKIHNL